MEKIIKGTLSPAAHFDIHGRVSGVCDNATTIPIAGEVSSSKANVPIKKCQCPGDWYLHSRDDCSAHNPAYKGFFKALAIC